MTAEQKDFLETLTIEKDTFSFRIPKTHASYDPSAVGDDANKVTKEFSYPVCKDEAEALQAMQAKEWDIVEMVNDTLKANARSSAYQTALAAYSESTVSPEKIRERMIKDFIRSGLSEEQATAVVDSALAQK